MKRASTFVVALAIIVTAFVATAQSNPMRPGRWEVTVQMEMPNMPIAMPAMRDTRCVTQKDIDSPNRGLPSGPNKNPNDCKISDYKISGSTVTWTMACTGQAAMTGTGELRFSGDAYDGVMKMMMDQHQVTMKMSGKRLGDCTP